MKLEMAGPLVEEEQSPSWPDDRLVKCCRRGEHIALTCKDHPTLKWSTKNIHGRTLFFFGLRKGFGLPTEGGWENEFITAEGELVKECNCPASSLVHIHEEGK
jgi:hypothetical protein